MTNPRDFHDDPFVRNRSTPRLVVFSGAGISAESGISTFRDANGLWEQHNIDDVCNIQTFDENYDLVHKFYNQRRVQLGTVKPNIAHETVAMWQKKYGADRVSIITANVDDLFERAGAEKVTHIHGKLTEMIVRYGEDAEHVEDIGYNAFDIEQWKLHNVRAKPNVVFFNECFRYDAERNKVPIYDHMMDVLRTLTHEDTVMVIGTSETVVPIWYYIEARPCRTVWVNPENSKHGQYDTSFIGSACRHILNIDEYLVKERME